MTTDKPDSSPASLFRTGYQPERHANRRRTGSRAKLAKKFFEDTYAAWEEQGESALARAAFHDPMGFVSMVARLMPQKIEVSTPTDGMSDERLAEMLDMAERMARLRAGDGAKVIEGVQPVATLPSAHEPADENGLHTVAAEEGGGGPLGLGGARGVNTPHTFTAEPGRIAETPYNKLDDPDSGSATAERHVAETPFKPPYPVGRATPEADHQIERRNRAKLEDDIDPESLF